MVGRPKLWQKPVDKRKRGNRNPPFLTKVEILLVLLFGEMSGHDIREHLRKILEIYDRGNIDDKLEELIADGFIIKFHKEGHVGKGLPPAYFKLSNKFATFDGMKELYEYIITHGMELKEKHNIHKDWTIEIIKSPCFQSLINDKIFPFLTYEFVQSIALPIVEIINSDLESLKKNPKYFQLVNEITTDKDAMQLFQEAKDQQKDGMELTEENIGMITELLFNKDIRSEIPEEMRPPAAFFMFGDIIMNLLFPVKERNEILEILKTSPSAVKMCYFPNDFGVDKSMTLFGAYIRYYMQYLHSFKGPMDDKQKTETPNLLSTLIQFSTTLNRKSASPFLVMLRAFLMNDYFNARINPTKWFAKYHVDLFTDDEAIKAYYKSKIDEDAKKKEAPK